MGGWAMSGKYLVIAVLIVVIGALSLIRRPADEFWRGMVGVAIFAELIYFLLVHGAPYEP